MRAYPRAHWAPATYGKWLWASLEESGATIALALWFSAFLGWLIKGAIMRWGGYKIYRNLRPFFGGLIIGDCIAGAGWIVVGLITKVGYPLLPL